MNDRLDRGREVLYQHRSPQVLETLREAAVRGARYVRSVKGGYSSRRSSMYASTRALHASTPMAKP